MSPWRKLIFWPRSCGAPGDRELRQRKIESDQAVAARRQLDGVLAVAASEVENYPALRDGQRVFR
jgi:hypothetical protein